MRKKSAEIAESWRRQASEEFLHEQGVRNMEVYNYLAAMQRRINEAFRRAGFPRGRL